MTPQSSTPASVSAPTTPRLGEPTEHDPRWRMPRFGLRSLLLFMVLCTIPLTWWTWTTLETRRQTRVIERLLPYGAQAGWRNGRVVQLVFVGDAFQDRALSELGALPNLRRVVLLHTNINAGGLTALSKLPLEELRIMQAPALHPTSGDQDLGNSNSDKTVRWPATLQSLWLVEAQLQDADLIGLTKIPQLSSLSLIGSPITDAAVPTLAKLQQLQELFVGGTRLTAAGIAELKRELPKARLDQDRPVQLPAESRDDAFPPEE